MTQSPARIHMRYLEPHGHLGSTFGDDPFGRFAERFARAFGTPKFLAVQTGLVFIWLILNAAHVTGFDPYPFILLNLAFSTQAAYAAPMILLAQTRQSERDRQWTEADARHREEISDAILTLLRQNTELTQQVHDMAEQIEGLTREVHGRVVSTS
ncbi:MAG: DUF1003 domain-containing protein [Dehalococcoidia bacterium]|nr:MAG: DUF1003 domain-containing protein [Dehalococcoidia bacterium]